MKYFLEIMAFLLASTLFASESKVIKAKPLIQVIITPNPGVVEPDSQLQFKADATDSAGNPLEATINWTVTPKTLGRIDSIGLFTASPKEGNGTVSAITKIKKKHYIGKAVVKVSTKTKEQQPKRPLPGVINRRALY
jgi:hypothetical protein